MKTLVKTARLTVTIPKGDYERIEREKKQKGVGRSKFVSYIFEKFFQKEDEATEIKKYIAGYKKHPENIKEIEALTKASLAVLEKYGYEER